MRTELKFGSLSNRELTVLLSTPSWRWWRPFSRSSWSFWWVLHRNASHRCYCPEGTMFDGRLCVAGFNMTWYYSHYTGEMPCVCDRTIEEFEESA